MTIAPVSGYTQPLTEAPVATNFDLAVNMNWDVERQAHVEQEKLADAGPPPAPFHQPYRPPDSRWPSRARWPLSMLSPGHPLRSSADEDAQSMAEALKQTILRLEPGEWVRVERCDPAREGVTFRVRTQIPRAGRLSDLDLDSLGEIPRFHRMPG